MSEAFPRLFSPLALGRVTVNADDELLQALQDTGPAIHLIGDALAPRRVHEAILEATRIAQAI